MWHFPPLASYCSPCFGALWISEFQARVPSLQHALTLFSAVLWLKHFRVYWPFQNTCFCCSCFSAFVSDLFRFYVISFVSFCLCFFSISCEGFFFSFLVEAGQQCEVMINRIFWYIINILNHKTSSTDLAKFLPGTGCCSAGRDLTWLENVTKEIMKESLGI